VNPLFAVDGGNKILWSCFTKIAPFFQARNSPRGLMRRKKKERKGSPNDHLGVFVIFTSFRRTRNCKELIKKGREMVLPTWSTDEKEDNTN